jgi:hypothetical protein
MILRWYTNVIRNNILLLIIIKYFQKFMFYKLALRFLVVLRGLALCVKRCPCFFEPFNAERSVLRVARIFRWPNFWESSIATCFCVNSGSFVLKKRMRMFEEGSPVLLLLKRILPSSCLTLAGFAG